MHLGPQRGSLIWVFLFYFSFFLGEPPVSRDKDILRGVFQFAHVAHDLTSRRRLLVGEHSSNFVLVDILNTKSSAHHTRAMARHKQHKPNRTCHTSRSNRFRIQEHRTRVNAAYGKLVGVSFSGVKPCSCFERNPEVQHPFWVLKQDTHPCRLSS